MRLVRPEHDTRFRYHARRAFLTAGFTLALAACARSTPRDASNMPAPETTLTPGPRTSPGLVYSPALRRVLLTDGYSFGDTADFPSGKIWSWDGKRWQPLGRNGPPARTLAA